VEQQEEFVNAIEMATFQTQDAVVSVNWNDLDFTGATKPELRMRVGCGQAAGCDIRWAVEIRDAKDLGNGPLIDSKQGPEVFDQSFTDVVYDLTAYKDTVMRITLVMFTDTPDPEDVIFMEAPRVVEAG
jgi:hypothetical protein